MKRRCTMYAYDRARSVLFLLTYMYERDHVVLVAISTLQRKTADNGDNYAKAPRQISGTADFGSSRIHVARFREAAFESRPMTSKL